MKENGLEHVTFSTADGALEAAPAVRINPLLLTYYCIPCLIYLLVLSTLS